MGYQRKTYQREEVTKEPFVAKYPPSVEQRDIFDELRFGYDNVHCNAGAGSGKSTTMLWAVVKMLQEWKWRKSIKMMAFGKDIAKELTRKVPDGVDVGTMHSFGYRALKRRFPSAEVKAKGESKNSIILTDIDWLDPDRYKGDQKNEAYGFLKHAERLISLIKLTLTDWNDRDGLQSLVDRYQLDFTKLDAQQHVTDMSADLFAELPRVFDRIMSMTEMIDFDDMMWMPIQFGLPIDKGDMVFLDEAQDANNLMIEYANRMCGERIMTVGDRWQSIYGFAGANPESIDKLVRNFDSKEMNLMTCYRCGKKIIEYVNQLMPDLKAFEGNVDGEVKMHWPPQGPDDKPFDLNDLPDGSMILARRNAALVGPCFQLIKKGRKAIIKGKEIGAALSALVDQINRTKPGMTMIQFTDAVDVYRNEKIDTIMKRKKPSQSAVEYTNDQCDALLALAEGATQPWEIKGKIDYVFSNENVPGITLSSGHKSKGLEAPQVAIVEAERIRIHRENMSEDDVIQERNLEYVMKTRPKTHLHMVYSGK